MTTPKTSIPIDPTTEQQQTPSATVIPLQLSYMDKNARLWMAALLILSDSLILMLAGLTAVGLRMLPGNLVNPPFYWTLVPMIVVFLAAYAMRGLYQAVGLSPVEELQRLTVTTSLVFLLVTGYTFWARTAEYYSRLVFAYSWIIALILLPAGRWLVRLVAVRLGTWGEPVAIVGCGSQTRQIANFLLKRARFGLRPVLLIGRAEPSSPLSIPAYPFEMDADLDQMVRTTGIQTAILVTSELPPDIQDAIVNQQKIYFRHLILISNLNWIGSLGVIPHDLEGILGLEVRQNLLNLWDQRLKRTMDILLSIGIGVLGLPLLGLIAIWVRLDSPGKVFFRHARVGKNGMPFHVLKFRTMVNNAELILNDYLQHNPIAEKEWQQSQKIKDDPRVTRAGNILRKLSLDELPQLWNVLKGEMSLVGPRPIVSGEINYYQKGFTLYKRVRPGITGLWQVSGRTDVNYPERVRFDEYYVRNWSIWLDVYILLRTLWIVINGKGAY